MIQSDIEKFQAQALDGSVFDDYGTMVLMRGIGSVVMAMLMLILIFYPLYALLWRYLKQRFPSVGENMYLKRHKGLVRDRKEYQEYLEWAADKGYEPLYREGHFKNNSK